VNLVRCFIRRWKLLRATTTHLIRLEIVVMMAMMPCSLIKDYRLCLLLAKRTLPP
jgi:hypothetical protein